MDKPGTGNSLDLTSFSASYVPVAGFDWVEGYCTWHADYPYAIVALVHRPGDFRTIPVKDDLYVEFGNLRDTREEMLKFAECYGCLGIPARHFHRAADQAAQSGEDLADWSIHLRRFKTALDLWYCAKARDRFGVRRILEPLQPNRKHEEPFLLHCPPFPVSDPMRFAREIVVNTINWELAPAAHNDPACSAPGCTYRGYSGMWGDFTRAALMSNNDRLDLRIASNNLLKTLWLQFAASVAGQRKVKQCEAPDCGRYMDVTNSKRPGARRMHPKCEERIKKRRHREKLRREP